MRGLVRNNKLSDLTDPLKARENLRLSAADYDKIRGLYTVSGLTNVAIQGIAGSESNYQLQINSLNSALSSIDPSLYASISGDTLTGTWTNEGTIIAETFVVSGVTLAPSTDSTFTQVSGSSRINANSTITINNNLSALNLEAEGSIAVASGKTIAQTMPVRINGIAYKIETT
jgi:hypothetical protein